MYVLYKAEDKTPVGKAAMISRIILEYGVEGTDMLFLLRGVN